MLHTSYIELSKSALRDNLKYMRSKINNGTRYSMVVKANAYGHGIEDLVPVAEELDVDHFSVFSQAEAMRVWNVKKTQSDILIMGWVSKDQMKWAINNDVSFFVFTLERIEAARQVASEMEKPARIHIEVETGMYRTGFQQKELEKAVEMINKYPDCLKVEGICTHFAGAESFNNFERVYQQIENFNRLCTWVNEQGIHPDYRHTACSAGLLNFPDTALDLVRIGIANYGFWPSSETRMRHIYHEDGIEEDPLIRVLTWKSEVMSVNKVPEGKYVSYGTSFLTNRPTKIATVPVGYGYGYSRNLSNLGHVLINGKRAPVIGTVNMNMMVVDVTDINEVKTGDEVVLIGKQGDRAITVASFSDMNKGLNYELLTRLPDHIPRKVVD